MIFCISTARVFYSATFKSLEFLEHAKITTAHVYAEG